MALPRRNNMHARSLEQYLRRQRYNRTPSIKALQNDKTARKRSTLHWKAEGKIRANSAL